MENDSNGQFRILIVDDDADQRQLEIAILEAENFAVIEASNGREALDSLKRNEVDAVLLDKQMPVLDGDTTCEKIRNELNLKLLPILMVTGNNNRDELLKSLNAGANDFISKPYSPTELVARVKAAANHKRTTDQLDNIENMLYALARMVESKDQYTGNHCARLSHTAKVFGKRLGLGEEDLEALSRGGVLHDIGKLGIPDRILLKQDKLDEAEWNIMKTHTSIGYHICHGLRSLRTVIPIILHHHERWDGSGYPFGLKGHDIPLIAQVFQLVDVYDALTNERPYKKAFSIEKTMAIIRQETQLGWRNPELIREFFELLKQEPESLLLPQAEELNEGEQIFKKIINVKEAGLEELV